MAAFIYDGDCSFCLFAVTWLKRRGGSPDVFFHAYQSSPLELAFAGLSPEDCRRAVYVTEDRRGRAMRVHRGSSAITYALRALPGIRNAGWRLLGTVSGLPGLRLLADIGYAWIARNRQHLGSPICGLPRQGP